MATDDQSVTGNPTATAIESFIGRLAETPIASLAVILVVAVGCFLPGMSTMPPLDGFEPRTMVAAQKMVVTGDYATVRLQTVDGTWHARGPYWAAGLAIALAGEGHEPPLWAYRLPSFLAGIATALLTWWLAIAFGRPVAALLAGLFVAGSGLMALEARVASADMLLAMTVVLAAGALARVWLRDDATAAIAALFWTGLGLAVLAKGLVAPAIFAATVLVLSIERGSFSWLARLRPRGGIVWSLVLAAPWAIAVLVTFLTGAASEAPTAETLRALVVPFTVVAPPGSYAIFAGFIAGPALTFALLGAGWIVDHLRQPAVFFALAWAVPLWLVGELIDAKLPQYVLPAIPAIAMLAGTAIDAGGVNVGGWAGRIVSLAPFASRVLAAVVFPLAFLYWQGRFPGIAFLALVAAAVLAWVAWRWLSGGDVAAAAALSVVGIGFAFYGFFGVLVPGLDGLRIGARVAAVVESSVPCSNPLVATSGYPEESMVLAVGPGTLFVDAAGAADFLDGGRCRAAAVDVSQISSFRQRVEDIGLELVDRGRVRGLNLRKMRRVDVHVFTTGSPAP